MAMHAPLSQPKPNYESQWVYVTPALAAEWLRLNTNNRTLRQPLVQKYAQDLIDGTWPEHHQGIAFDTENAIVDGQHRLEAIRQTGVAVWMLVTRGLDPSVRLVVDDHGRRDISDRLHLVGHKDASIMGVATLRRMLAGLTLDPRAITRITKLRTTMLTHGQALAFTDDCFRVTQRGITVAAVRAVVARAYYNTADHERLRAFAHVVTTGMMTESGDAAAILLRNNLLMTPQHGRGAHSQRAIYAKTERALAAFLKHETLAKLYETQRELFPLPEEAEAAKARRRRVQG